MINVNYYYLFGESICRKYEEDGVGAVIVAILLEENDFELCEFNRVDGNPSDLLLAFKGWDEFVELSEEEYDMIYQSIKKADD